MNIPPRIRYPRKVIVRSMIRLIGRLLIHLLVRAEVTGLEKIPRRGPVILAGNHVGILEIVLMAAIPPRQVEFVGAGDLPLDPNFAPLAALYGFIPIQRGILDREGLRGAVDVLRQSGVIAVFPEGGIWNPANMQEKIGVAYISQEAQAAVVPIGFSGMRGAMKELAHFKRPRIRMAIGEPLPPVSAFFHQNRRETLEQGAQAIFEGIQALLPEKERSKSGVPDPSHFEVILMAESRDGRVQQQFISWSMAEQDGVGRFLLQPVMLDALQRNLRLPIRSLSKSDSFYSTEEMLCAVQSILQYLEKNPGFFTYRFGMEQGIATKQGLINLEQTLQALRPVASKIQVKASVR